MFCGFTLQPLDAGDRVIYIFINSSFTPFKLCFRLSVVLGQPEHCMRLHYCSFGRHMGWNCCRIAPEKGIWCCLMLISRASLAQETQPCARFVGAGTAASARKDGQAQKCGCSNSEPRQRLGNNTQLFYRTQTCFGLVEGVPARGRR